MMSQKTALKLACVCAAVALGGLLLAKVFPWLTVVAGLAGAFFGSKALSDQRGLGTMLVTLLMTTNLVLIAVVLILFAMGPTL